MQYESKSVKILNFNLRKQAERKKALMRLRQKQRLSPEGGHINTIGQFVRYSVGQPGATSEPASKCTINATFI